MSDMRLQQSVFPQAEQKHQEVCARNNLAFKEGFGAGKTAGANDITYSIPSSSMYQVPQTSIYPQFTGNNRNDKSSESNSNEVVLTPQQGEVVLNPAGATNVYIINPTGYMAPGNTPNSAGNNNSAVPNPVVPSASPVSDSDKKPAASTIEDDRNVKNGSIQGNKNKRRVHVLTDDLIKMLESYLRNENKQIRMQGATELVELFEEDKDRFDDPALTALLNIGLQDKSADVRSLLLSLAASGIVKGDDKTIEILKNLTQNNSNYGLDAITASKALLKMSSDTEMVEDTGSEKKA